MPESVEHIQLLRGGQSIPDHILTQFGCDKVYDGEVEGWHMLPPHPGKP